MSMSRSRRLIFFTILYWTAYIYCFNLFGYSIGVVFSGLALIAFMFMAAESEWLFCLSALPFMSIFKIIAFLPSTSIILYCIFIAKVFKTKRAVIRRSFFIRVVFLIIIQTVLLVIYGQSMMSMISLIINLFFIMSSGQILENGETDTRKLYLDVVFIYVTATFIMSLGSYLYPELSKKVAADTTFILGGEVTSRFAGIAGDPNYYTQLILVAITMAIAAIIKCRMHIIARAYLCGASLFLVFCGMMTYSKSFYLTLGIISFIFLWYIYRDYINSKSVMLLLIIITPVIIICVYYGVVNFILPGIMQRVTDTVDLTSGRIEIWKAYMTMLVDHPINLLFGAGMANGRNLLIPYYGEAQAAHNGFLELFADTGIVGCALIFSSLKEYFQKGIKVVNDMCMLPVFAFLITSMGLSFSSYDTVCFTLPLIFVIAKDIKKGDSEES